MYYHDSLLPHATFCISSAQSYDSVTPIPVKSSCVFCPYHSNRTWREIKENYPEEWKKVIKVDKAIRDSSKRGDQDQLFLHRSLKPIEEAYLQEDQEELFMCEEGFCGI